MRARIIRVFVLVGVACGLAGSTAMADNCFLAWTANSCGGERMLGTNRVAVVSLGQLTIGETASGPRMASLGALSAEQPAPLLAASPNATKIQADGAWVAIGGLVVTSDYGVFSDRIYAQTPMRWSGIALVGGRAEAALAREGSRVNVVGGVSTLNGERVMLNPIVTVLDDDEPPAVLGMTNRFVGGTALGVSPLGQRGVVGGYGLNNVGLLVRTFGVVIDNGLPDYILINDSAKTPFWDTGLRVARANLGSLPEIGSYVVVDGISGVRVRGSVLDAIVRPRKPGDLEVLLATPPGGLSMRLQRREEK